MAGIWEFLTEKRQNPQASLLMTALGIDPNSPEAEALNKAMPGTSRLDSLTKAFAAMSDRRSGGGAPLGRLGAFGASLADDNSGGSGTGGVDLNGVAGILNAMRPARKGSQPALLDLMDRLKETTDPNERAVIEDQIKKLNTPDQGSQGAESMQLIRAINDPNTDPSIIPLLKERFQFMNTHRPRESTNVNVGVNLPAAEKAGATAFGTGVGKNIADDVNSAQAGLKAIEGYNQISNLADSALTGGMAAEGISSLVNTFSGPVKQVFGIDLVPEKLQNRVAARETMQAISRKAVMDSLGGSLGAQISNADVAFVQSTVPNAEMTPSGIKAVALSATARAEWEAEYAIEKASFFEQNGITGKDSEGLSMSQHMKKWAENNRMFSSKYQDQIKRLVGASKQEWGDIRFPETGTGSSETRQPALPDRILQQLYGP